MALSRAVLVEQNLASTKSTREAQCAAEPRRKLLRSTASCALHLRTSGSLSPCFARPLNQHHLVRIQGGLYRARRNLCDWHFPDGTAFRTEHFVNSLLLLCRPTLTFRPR